MSIALQVRLLACTLVAMTAALVGTVVYLGYQEVAADWQQDELARRVTTEARRFELAMQELRNDVNLLVSLPVLDVIAADPTTALQRDSLAELFAVVMRAKPHYRQLRLIAAAGAGRELVRVDHTEQGLSRVAEADLQDKGHRDYFGQAMRAPLGVVFFSNIDFNRERGQLEVPHRAVMRAARIVPGKDGKPFGIIMVNLDFKRFIGDVFESVVQRREMYLTNAQGDYLVHPEDHRTFGFALGKPQRVQDDLPSIARLCAGATADEGPPSDAHALSPDGRTRWHFQRLHPFADGGRHLLLGLSSPVGTTRANLRAIAMRALAWTVALLFFALVTGWLLAARLVRPLGRLTGVAEQIAAGDENVAVPKTQSGEVGELAAAFQSMLMRLQQKRRLLQTSHAALEVANEELQRFAHLASHDLREPARRIQGLADLVRSEASAVPSEEVQNLVLLLQQTAGRMLTQITDFRVFCKLAPGSLQSEKVSIAHIAESILAENADQLVAREIVTEVDATPELDVYPSLVTVLYRALIRNVLAHTVGRGVQIHCTCTHEVQGWVFGVRNSGSHLPADQLERLFEPFTRFSSSVLGSGMGLAIARRIVECHDGRIWALSDSDSVHVQFTLATTSNARDSNDHD